MRSIALWTCVLSLTVAACGGGGGDGGPAAPLLGATSVGGPNTDRLPAVAAFADGAHILTGAFAQQITLGAGEANETTLVSAGSDDAFVARFDAGGTLAWAVQIEGPSTVRAIGVSTVPDGSCLVVGQYDGTATLGPGEANQTVLASAGSNDLFVARYQSNGQLAWAKRAGGVDAELMGGVSALADGSCLVTGRFTGTAVFGLFETNQTTLVSAAGADAFVARYQGDGSLAWATQLESTLGSRAVGIAAFADGSSVACGSYDGSTTFGPGEPGQIVLTDAGDGEVFVARFDANGALDWARKAESTVYEQPYAMGGFADGSCVVVGESDGPITFGPGEPGETTLQSPGIYTPFVARYQADGTLAWAKTAQGPEYHEPYGVAAHADGTSTVTGSFSQTATFGPGEGGAATLTSRGGYDVFVARYESGGALRWARQEGGTDDEDGLGAAALPGGGALVTGTFRGSVTFGPGEPNETVLTAVGFRDLFLLRYP